MDIRTAKSCLDKIIRKSRAHFYKPIQIAEVLYHHRTDPKFDLADVEKYTRESKKWRDEISQKLVGRISTSSMRYQDDVFGSNAVPPAAIKALVKINKTKGGIVEYYIYQKLRAKLSEIATALDYCAEKDYKKFQLDVFLGLFRQVPGLKRSIDKIYEIIVYALFVTLIDFLQIDIKIRSSAKAAAALNEFSDFAERVLGISAQKPEIILPAKIFRAGVANAADRGIDIYGNFGYVIQIKHLSLTEESARKAVEPIAADRVIIVCKKSEEKLLLSVLNQIGWKSKIQNIVTEEDLLAWYDRALRGKFGDRIGMHIIKKIQEQLVLEFPASQSQTIEKFFAERRYVSQKDDFWS
jgi:hypothetical protein